MRLPENWDQWLFGIVFVGLILTFIFNIFRRGGVKAAMFNAEIATTVGEVSAASPKLISQQVRVHVLDRSGEKLVGIEIVSKSPMSYEMLPIVLSETQARALASLLREAGAR